MPGNIAPYIVESVGRRVSAPIVDLQGRTAKNNIPTAEERHLTNMGVTKAFVGQEGKMELFQGYISEVDVDEGELHLDVIFDDTDWYSAPAAGELQHVPRATPRRP